jgi:clan AA aspartic protease (TIGR02281 family)
MRPAMLLLALAATASADTVYLANGNQMEGTIVSQSASEIVLDIGYGTVPLKRSRIRRIVRSRSASRELEQRGFEAGRDVPEGFASIHRLYEAASAAREKALEARSLGAGEAQDEPEREKEAGQTQQAYYAAFKALQDELDAPEGPKVPAAGGREAAYDAWLRREAAKMAADFKSDVIESRDRSGHVIVQAILNGRVPARLIVDTGASTCVLYPAAYAELGLTAADELGTTKIYVGDGRPVDAKLVRLRSVAVGRSVATDTIAALVPTPAPGIDGLLGMSFLKNFVVRVDSANGKLFLETLKPR